MKTEEENGSIENTMLCDGNPFIASTARDYDMSHELVEFYYNRYGSTSFFYEKLEEHIKQRSF